MTDELEKATPRPWRVEVNLAKTLAQIFGNRGFGDWILNMEVEDQDGPAALGEGELANLALIVRAVNAYEPMREALAELEEAVSTGAAPFKPEYALEWMIREGGEATVKPELLLKCVRALRVADGEPIR